MAYRSRAAEPAPSAELTALRAEIDARTEALRLLGEALAAARTRADEVLRAADAKVATAEERRRRALLRALANAPAGPEADAIRISLRAERRERDLRLAVARARAPEDTVPESDEPLDVEAARQALAEAREARAREAPAAIARAHELEARVRALETELDDLVRERERLERASD